MASHPDLSARGAATIGATSSLPSYRQQGCWFQYGLQTEPTQLGFRPKTERRNHRLPFPFGACPDFTQPPTGHLFRNSLSCRARVLHQLAWPGGDKVDADCARIAEFE